MNIKKSVELKFSEFINTVKSPEITCDQMALELGVGFEIAAEMIMKHCVEEKKKLILIGNGGSATIAMHHALDFLNKCRVKAISFNDPALLTCISNDYGYEEVFSRPIDHFAEEGDVLIAISSSGESPNILYGVNAAKNKKCNIITMSGFSGNNDLRKKGDVNFYVPSHSYRFVEASHSFYCDVIGELVEELISLRIEKERRVLEKIASIGKKKERKKRK